MNKGDRVGQTPGLQTGAAVLAVVSILCRSNILGIHLSTIDHPPLPLVQKKGWEQITDGAISALSRERTGLVFLLWGKFAMDKAKLVEGAGTRHQVLTAAHPSWRSASQGFFGCRHFSKVRRRTPSLFKRGREVACAEAIQCWLLA